MPAKQHIKENSVVYGLIALLTGAGGVGLVTDNLPVTQGEYGAHLVEYQVASEDLKKIQGSLDQLVLTQLRASLLQAYKDKCHATDPQALTYINNEIENLQAQYVAITERRFEPPPCGVATG